MDKSLQAGDILIFQAGNDWLGKSIAWITKSNVSHAAMVYQTDSIVEMGAAGISVGKVAVQPGEGAYLLRLNPQQEPLPLCNAAEAYINAKTRYDFPALVILAGLLIYRQIRPTQKFVVICDLILRAACKEVDKLIQSLILHNPDKAMVCSQLVYQIYRDCGKAYSIQLENSDLQNDCLSESAENGIRLIDLLDSQMDTLADAVDIVGMPDGVELSAEELAHRLMESLQDESDMDMALPAVGINSMLVWAKKLLEELEEFLEKSQANIPLDALFVTPGDLLNHAKNLTQVSTLNIIRQR